MQWICKEDLLHHTLQWVNLQLRMGWNLCSRVEAALFGAWQELSGVLEFVS